MLRVKDLRPEEMSEVVRVAAELYQRDQAQLEVAKERQSIVEAAAELDVPAEYLERAAATLHAQRVARIQQSRRRRNGALAAGALALGLWGGWAVTHRPPPAPALYDFNASPESRWRLDSNPETRATLRFDTDGERAGVAVIQVDRFGAPDAGSPYFANLNTSDVPPTLAGYRSVSFRVRGDGLTRIRLYLEAGPNERWRSPPLTVSSGWQEHRLRLEEFDYQTRASANSNWRRQSYRPPGKVERLSFKVGDFVNEVDARGTVAVDDLRFE